MNYINYVNSMIQSVLDGLDPRDAINSIFEEVKYQDTSIPAEKPLPKSVTSEFKKSPKFERKGWNVELFNKKIGDFRLKSIASLWAYHNNRFSVWKAINKALWGYDSPYFNYKDAYGVAMQHFHDDLSDLFGISRSSRSEEKTKEIYAGKYKSTIDRALKRSDIVNKYEKVTLKQLDKVEPEIKKFVLDSIKRADSDLVKYQSKIKFK